MYVLTDIESTNDAESLTKVQSTVHVYRVVA